VLAAFERARDAKSGHSFRHSSEKADEAPVASGALSANDSSDLFGRGEWIRTTGLLVPNLMMAFSENAQNSMTSKLLQVKGLC
jgi:hypothetical protein